MSWDTEIIDGPLAFPEPKSTRKVYISNVAIVDDLREEVKELKALLKRASTCIWEHHEASYRPELGQICEVCCPDGNPFHSVLTDISNILTDETGI